MMLCLLNLVYLIFEWLITFAISQLFIQKFFKEFENKLGVSSS